MNCDPNNTPDTSFHGGNLQRLIRPRWKPVAEQARDMGIKVGDIIVGREGGGEAETGWWREQRLTLIYMGEQCCVWKSEWRSKSLPIFYDKGESTSWTLDSRDWYLVKNNKPNQ